MGGPLSGRPDGRAAEQVARRLAGRQAGSPARRPGGWAPSGIERVPNLMELPPTYLRTYALARGGCLDMFSTDTTLDDDEM